MTPRWMLSIPNLLLVAYGLDALLSVCEEVFRGFTGSGLLMAPREALATLVVYLALLCVPLLWATPRLPTGAFACLIGTVFWLNTGAAPVALAFDPGLSLGLFLSGLQLALAACMLLFCRRRNGAEGWLLRPQVLEGPLFSLRHSAVFALVGVFVAAPLALLYAVLSLLAFIQLGTQGFVSFDAVGVSLSDRHYQRGASEVRLVGMMHIGEEEAYEEIVSSFARESTIVLEEGVTDETARLEDGLSYAGVAESLGLTPQDDLRSYLADSELELPEWPVLRNADVDLEDFDPLTIEWLEWVSQLWASDDLLAALQELLAYSAENERQLTVVENDILHMRNEHLLVEVERALGEYQNVVVPWGALHLPFIESEILERGFEETRRQRQRLLAWTTVLAAIF